IRLVGVTGGSYSASLGTAGIDMPSVERFKWMGRDGRFQQERLGGNVIHELIHAIWGKADLVDPTTRQPLGLYDLRDYNNRNFDHLGETVQLQNAIFQEMDWGFGYWQVGYDAIVDSALTPLARRNLIQNDTGFSYTEGQSIAIAYFDDSRNKTPNNLDLSQR